jgi:glutamine amidotransferase
MKVLVIDYGLGNLFSVASALQKLDYEVSFDREGRPATDADAMLLPGVAAFEAGMRNLQTRGQDEIIRGWVNRGKPLLGLCLGAQLLLECSEESPGVSGFGFIGGYAANLGKSISRVPNQGWSKITLVSQNSRQSEVEDNPFVYFSHSFELVPSDPSSVLMTTEVETRSVVAGIISGSVVGLQFHPERSGVIGIRLLDRIVRNMVKNG